MKNLGKLTLIASLVFLSHACTDLEEELRGDYTETFDPANPGLGQEAGAVPDGLGGAFGELFNGTANHENYFSIQEVSTDEAVITQKGGDWFDGGIWLDMHRHEWQSTHPAVRNAWNTTYVGISQCNLLLAEADVTLAQEVQLRTLRAYFYWRLMDLYGRVKVITEPDSDQPQVDRDEVFDFIEAELLAVIPDLPTGRAVVGRTNQASAYALLARLYLNAEIYTGAARYQDAIDASDEVINSGLYALSASYADVFSPSNGDNIEHMWVVPFDEATGLNMNFAQMTLHYPSQLTYRLAEQPWNGYSTLEEFYNSYEDADLRKANNFIVGPQFDLQGNPVLDLAYDQADDGPEVVYTPEINQLAPNGSRQAGARLGKFSFKIGQLANMDNDYPLFRYGEILLTKAEALSRLGGAWNPTPEALMLVNELRVRADVDPYVGTISEAEFLAERGREMFQESSRRTDLIRFGAWGNTWWEKTNSEPHRILFPIPNDAILAAEEDFPLTQNPGY